MTILIIKARERLYHYSNTLEVASNGEKSIFITILTQMIRGLEQQPFNLRWQKDVLQTFQNMDNSSFFQVGWSQMEWIQLRAELYLLSRYLEPQRQE